MCDRPGRYLCGCVTGVCVWGGCVTEGLYCGVCERWVCDRGCVGWVNGVRTRDQLSRDQLPHDQLLQYQLFMKSTTIRSTLMKSEDGQAVGVDLAKVDLVCATRVNVWCTAASWSCICPPKVGRLIDIWKPSVPVEGREIFEVFVDFLLLSNLYLLLGKTRRRC